MIEALLSVSATFTVGKNLNDDMLPGPYDPSEGDTAFATLFDLRPVGGFFENLIF